MRITFVCPPDSPAGGMRVIAIYAARLARRGHEVTAVIAADPRPSLRQIARSLLRDGGRSLRPRSLQSYFADAPFTVRRLAKPGPIRDQDVPDGDLVIATWWETVEWTWALSGRKGTKLHFMQDYENWFGPADRIDAVYGLPLPRIVIARWEVDLLRDRWGQEAVACVPNAVDPERFFAPPRGKQERPTVGLLYTSFFNKGCDVSLAAVRRAREEVPSLHLVAFGSERPRPELPLPPGTDFHFEVPDDRLRTIYGRCDAWLFGTRIEGFGLPILEAMACRTPVIGTAAGAAPDLIGQGGGILVEREDVEAMAEGIVRICRMGEAAWRALSERAFHVARSYTWEDATDRFEEALWRIRAGEVRSPDPSQGVERAMGEVGTRSSGRSSDLDEA